MPSGYEDRLIRDFLSKEWALDAFREAYGAGPDEVFLQFPLGSLITNETGPAQLRRRIYEAIASQFGNLIQDDQIKARRGYQYAIEVNGRANDLLKDQRFRGRWLQAKIHIDVTTTGNADRLTADRIVLNVPDGFLPPWRDSQTNAPPQPHTSEFHLMHGSSDQFKNFKSLEILQTAIANVLADKLGGDVEFDPYAR